MISLKSTLFFLISPSLCLSLFPETGGQQLCPSQRHQPLGAIILSPSKGWKPAPQAIISYNHKICVLRPWQLARVIAYRMHPA